MSYAGFSVSSGRHLFSFKSVTIRAAEFHFGRTMTSYFEKPKKNECGIIRVIAASKDGTLDSGRKPKNTLATKIRDMRFGFPRNVTLRVFISSPSDVNEERLLAVDILRALSGIQLGKYTVNFEPMLWEDSPAVIGDGPQEAIDYYLGHASEADIFVSVFWRRIGTPTKVKGVLYSSGSEYELGHAIESWTLAKKPTVMLYRCQSLPPTSTHTEVQDSGGVDRLISRFMPDSPQSISLSVAEARSALDELLGGSVELRQLALGGLPKFYGIAEVPRDESIEEVLQEFAQAFKKDISSVAEKLLQERDRPLSRQDIRQRDIVSVMQNFLDGFHELVGDKLEVSPRLTRVYSILDSESFKECGVATEASLISEGEIVDAFRGTWRRKMLIVGERGAGKTYELTYIMKWLLKIARVKPSPENRVPVYFNLSGWHPSVNASGADAFDEWLIDQLVKRYSMPRRTARSLVENNEIIVCLDGLDELSPEIALGKDAEAAITTDLHTRCIQEINAWLDNRPVEMLMCCRTEVIEQVGVWPLLGPPVSLNRLSRQDVVDSLSKHDRFTALREVLLDIDLVPDTDFTPLVMRLMEVAYAGQPISFVRADLEANRDARMQGLVSRYLQNSISHADSEEVMSQVTTKEMTRYLRWVASSTAGDFLIEDFQPSLLSSKRSLRAYHWRSIVFIVIILTLSVSIPCATAIFIEWSVSHPIREAIHASASVGFVCISALTIFATAGLRSKRWWVFGGLVALAISIARYGVMAYSSPLSPTVSESSTLEPLRQAALTYPAAFAVFGLYSAISTLFVNRAREKTGDDLLDIVPLENLSWSWIDRDEPWRGAWIGLVIGPAIGLLFLLLSGLGRAIAFGAISTAITTLLAGFSGSGIKVGIRPNQGIERSFYHAICMAFVITIVGAVSCFVGFGYQFGLLPGIVNAVLACVLPFTFLLFGGVSVIRHTSLGIGLHAEGATPSWYAMPPWKNCVRLFNDLVALKILRRTAGGFMFRHEVLREYYRQSPQGPQRIDEN